MLNVQQVESPYGKFLRLAVTNGPEPVVHGARAALIDRCRKEQHQLRPLVSLVLNFCLAKKDDCVGLLKIASREMLMWKDACGEECLRFFAAAATVARPAMITTCAEWVPGFLKTKKLRQDTARLLAACVFVEPHPTAPDTAARLRLTRLLSAALLPELLDVHNRGVRNALLVDCYGVVKMIERWLATVHKEIQGEEDSHTMLGHEISTEYEESKRTLSDLQEAIVTMSDLSHPSAEEASSEMESASDMSGSEDLDMNDEE
jgi:hypothetical protein